MIIQSTVIQEIILSANKYKIHAILDDAWSKTTIDKGITKSNTDYLKAINVTEYLFVIAIGDNHIRKKLVGRYSIPRSNFPVITHPSAVVSMSSTIGEGTVIMPNAVINADTSIGMHSIINTGAIVEHDNFLEDFVHVSPGAVLAGGVTIGEGSHLGSASTVIPGKKIGLWCTVGAGAVVTRNLPDVVTAVGIPAKIIKE